MNGILLAIFITVAVVVGISVLIAVVLFVYTRDHSRQNIVMLGACYNCVFVCNTEGCGYVRLTWHNKHVPCT